MDSLPSEPLGNPLRTEHFCQMSEEASIAPPNVIMAVVFYTSGFYRATGVSRSVVSDFVTSWTVAHQAPLSLGFSA